MNAPSERPTFERLIALFALLCGAAAAVVFVASHWAWGDGDAIDRAVLVAVRRHAEQPGEAWAAMKQIMLFLTAIGSFPVLAVLTVAVAVVAAWSGHRKEAVRLVIVAGSGMAAANLVKHAFGRARPEVVAHWIEVSSLSFPSGHSADSTIAYLLFAVVAVGATDRSAIRRTLMALAFALIVLIGISRVYLGVHWPSDVLAGWAFGSTWAFLTAPLVRSARRRSPPSASPRRSDALP